MRTLALATTLLATSFLQAAEISITEPDPSGNSDLTLWTPDELVATFGQVDFRLDLSLQNSQLEELKIREAGLTLPDGREISTFAFNEEGNVIVVAADPVSHISIASVSPSGSEVEVLATFYTQNNEVIAPNVGDVAVFDLNYKQETLQYEPMAEPQSAIMPVSVLLDTSGSMAGALPDAIAATESFLANLPEWSDCEIFTFGDGRVTELTVGRFDRSCPRSIDVLQGPIRASGSTPLYEALERVYKSHDSVKSNQPGERPRLAVVITDGVDSGSSVTQRRLTELKMQNQVSSYVFWSGNFNPNDLRGLVDLEITTLDQIKNEMVKFYNSIRTSLEGIQSLLIM